MTLPRRNNGNGGRPNLPWDVVLAKKDLRADYDRTVCKLIMMKQDDIAKIAIDVEAPGLHRILAKAIINLLQLAEVSELDKLLDRTLGKAIGVDDLIARDTIELAKSMIALSSDERIKLLESRLGELKAGKE